MSEIPVTKEMLEVGAEIWWQTRDQPLYPQLEAAYRAMRALEPEPTGSRSPKSHPFETWPPERKLKGW